MLTLGKGVVGGRASNDKALAVTCALRSSPTRGKVRSLPVPMFKSQLVMCPDFSNEWLSLLA